MIPGEKTSLQASRSNKLIYIVDDDPLQSKLLAVQISHFGYTPLTFATIDELKNAIRQEFPAAVLMDIIFPEGDLAGVDAIAELRKNASLMPPVFFVSGSSEMSSRIKAVRAGGDAYFTKPVNIGLIIDALDRMTLGEDPEPYRVLIIDDSLLQAKTNAMILSKVGMIVSIITDPVQMEGSLDESNPDLILLDMYLENCNGTELAKVIRQMDSFLSVPIVYLSSETDRNKQLEAVELGGDDFLVKPIKAEHLISAATARIERYRQLRKLMYHDSLTGLLNHGMLKERLRKEIAQANRQKNSTLSFAMIDLDHFKSVNDRYGHPAGDRVIKSLSQMLTRRLRTTDIVGRYGGEEFGIIFPNTDQQTAFNVIEDLRENFADICHRAGTEEFTVTLSCGISSYPDCSAPDELCKAADQALYEAKSQGRNRTICNRRVS